MQMEVPDIEEIPGSSQKGSCSPAVKKNMENIDSMWKYGKYLLHQWGNLFGKFQNPEQFSGGTFSDA